MEPMIGEVRIFAGNFAPRGWAFCEGQLLAINSNQALFSILGTTYGGDGRTSFGLPDLRGRVPIGPGTGPGLPTYRLGQKSGSPTTTLNVTNLPPHNHNTVVQVNTEDGEESNPNGGILASSGIYAEDATPNAGLGGVVSGNTGGGQSFNNMQPSLATYYIIALQGIFPSRN